MLNNENINNVKVDVSNNKVQKDLFPPLIKKLNRVKLNVLINNKYIFPKVGTLRNESIQSYIGHIRPVIKIVFINNKILCSISQDSVSIKMWDLNNFNALCIKNILVNFVISDIILANENNLVVCGEKLILLNIDTEKQIDIFKPKFGIYIEYNLLARISDELGAASSLGGYFLIFNLNTGEKIKRIEMNKVHYICDSENKEKLMNNSLKEKDKGKNIKLDIIKNIGSSKCLCTEKGHKGQVFCILGLNNDSFKDCVISGGFDNLIKIFYIHEENKVVNLIGHENTVTNLALSESKKNLFSSSLDFTIRKWNLENISCEKIIKYEPGTQYILIPMMNEFLLTIGYDGKINIWNEEGLMVKSYHYQHGAITTGLLFPSEKESERNMYFFGDHTGEIFVKQIIIGDDNINNYYKEKKLYDLRSSKLRISMKKKDKSKSNSKDDS